MNRRKQHNLNLIIPTVLKYVFWWRMCVVYFYTMNNSVFSPAHSRLAIMRLGRGANPVRTIVHPGVRVLI